MSPEQREAIRDKETFLLALFTEMIQQKRNGTPSAGERVPLKKHETAAPASVQERVAKRAAELRAENSRLTKQQAIARAYDEHPDWYAAECAVQDQQMATLCGFAPDPAADAGLAKIAKDTAHDPPLESFRIQQEIADDLSALHRDLAAQRDAAYHGQVIPAITERELLARYLQTPEGSRQVTRWLTAIDRELGA